MRLGFAIAVHVRADVLLLDEVFAVGDEAFQRKCVDRILDFSRQGGTLCFVSHAASAIEHLCDRAVLLQHGRVEYDGETEEALRRYQALLAAEEAPAEVGIELRESGTGELRVVGLAVEGSDGVSRDQFVSGEPVSVRVLLEADAAIPTARLSLELRDLTGALLGASQADLAELGWQGTPGIGEMRFCDRSPAARGRDFPARHDARRRGRLAPLSPGRPGGAVRGLRLGLARGPLLFEGEWTLAGTQPKVGAA